MAQPQKVGNALDDEVGSDEADGFVHSADATAAEQQARAKRVEYLADGAHPAIRQLLVVLALAGLLIGMTVFFRAGGGGRERAADRGARSPFSARGGFRTREERLAAMKARAAAMRKDDEKVFWKSHGGEDAPGEGLEVGQALDPSDAAGGRDAVESKLSKVPEDWRRRPCQPPGTVCQDVGEQVSCPDFVQPNTSAIKEGMLRGPVMADPSLPRRRRLYLFIIASAFTGSTSLLGLILTSPAASGLCREWLCEGMYALQRVGLYRWKRRWDASIPIEWGKALATWENFWDPDKAVLVEKGPEWHIPGRIDDLVDYFRRTRRAVGFLFMSRSACYPTKPLQGLPEELRCYDQGSLLLNALQVVRRANLSHHLVHYEDMLRDPYTVAKSILDAFPSLESLDPSRHGIAETLKSLSPKDKAHVDTPLAQYALRRAGELHNLQSVDARALAHSKCLGYHL